MFPIRIREIIFNWKKNLLAPSRIVGGEWRRWNIYVFIFLKQLRLWADTPKQASRDTDSDIMNKDLAFPSDKGSGFQKQPLILFLQTTAPTILMGFLAVTHWTTQLYQEFRYCNKMSAVIHGANSIRSQDPLENAENQDPKPNSAMFTP